jgi:DNA polymerase elongation subunit (family B)
MVATGSNDLLEVQKLGQRIKEAINKRYRKLELEIDGIFKVMLLLKKKKYAAITIDPVTRAEVCLPRTFMWKWEILFALDLAPIPANR